MNKPASELIARLEASQRACFDAGLHVAAMDIQSARAEIARTAARVDALREALEFGIWAVSGPTNEAEVERLEQIIEETWREYQAKATPPAQPAPAGGRYRLSYYGDFTPITVRGSTSETHGKPDGAVREEAIRLLAAEDERQSKLHDLLETIREQIRLEVPVEHRPAGLFKNIQDAVYAVRGRTSLMNDVAVTAALSPKIAAAETSPGDVLDVCPFCFGSGRHEGRFGHNDPECTNCNGVGKVAIDRLDVKAEAKSQEPDAVAVKPLEWREITAARSDEDPSHESTGDYEAVSSIGVYFIEMYFGSDSYGWRVSLNGDFASDHDDPDAAKAAAQADYEQRIRSALIRPTTKPEAPAVSVDAISLNGVTQVVYDHGPSFSWDECKKIAGSLLARFHITDRDARS